MNDKALTMMDYAKAFAESTNLPIFLTGKAGTGKTTFLRKLRAEIKKNVIIAAPTGIAAINAEGVTLHSLFQLPLGIFVPGPETNYALKMIRFSLEKRRLLQKMELLVIDEISMVRADIFDAIDHLLRMVRRSDKPFGGVQLLLIGDLFQLSPVVQNNEWPSLQKFYESPYFFDSLVASQIQLINIELTHIFRQNDSRFINLLNAVRTGTYTEQDLKVINQRVQPPPPEDGDFSITLTTLNEKADAINQTRLEALPGEPIIRKATVKGEFPSKASPAEEVLKLKVGAQVMFIKNDVGENRRYYNGKMAIVESLSEHSVSVRTQDNILIEVKEEIWANTRFQLSASGQIEQEELGSFCQLPLRLAWAITIHKSQGLTFEKACIDAGESFAAGQVYVALSRLTSIEGLLLLSPISRASIITDKNVLNFSSRISSADQLEKYLKQGNKNYLVEIIAGALNVTALMDATTDAMEKFSDQPALEKAAAILSDTCTITEKFLKHLGLLLQHQAIDVEFVRTRIKKSIDFFSQKIEECKQIFSDGLAALQRGKDMKKLKKTYNDLVYAIEIKKDEFHDAIFIFNLFIADTSFPEMRNQLGERCQERLVALSRCQSDTNPEVGPGNSTLTATLEQFKNGLNLSQIAAKRRISVATAELHLCSLVEKGSIAITELVTEEKVSKIQTLLQSNNALTITQMRGQLGSSYSFSEIRFVIAFSKSTKNTNNQPVIKNGNLFAL